MRTILMAVFGAVLSTFASAQTPPLTPFVLPYDDAKPGPTDVSAWQPAPAGKDGPIRIGPDAHFYAGAQRIRFLGVNLTFAGNFPTHADAEKVAGRMAKFGINAVRFHHMDMQRFPTGIMDRQSNDSRHLDPEALDRLDYLIAQLKAHGIYGDLNLLVSRNFHAADGLPAEIDQVPWKEQAVVGFWYEPHLKLQQEYARALLTHQNAYTKNTYTQEPALAFIEINNENGLLNAWLGQQVDKLPKVFLDDLQRQWNVWLRAKYGSTDKLGVAWGSKREALGAELIVAAPGAPGAAWNLETHNGAAGTLKATGGELTINVTTITGTGWHVQLNHAGVALKAGRIYTLSFQAKAKEKARLTVGLRQTQEPWGNLGLSAGADLTDTLKPFTYTFIAPSDEANARVDFSDLGAKVNTITLSGVSLKPGGAVGLEENQKLEDGSIPIFQRAGVKGGMDAALRDWIAFLWQTENHYWQSMYRFLKDDLGVKAQVFGTIVACSTPGIQGALDVVDTHAYWQHPQFPGRAWDASNWTVGNVSMVNAPGGVLPGLARQRVAGKPLVCTEYNHAAPNTYASETALLIAAFGALQDWDGFFLFDYNGGGGWNGRKISNYFSIDQHPTKMANLPLAAALFTRGDLAPAKDVVTVPLSPEAEWELIRTKGHAWGPVDDGTIGVPGEATLLHRFALEVGGKLPANQIKVPEIAGLTEARAAKRYVSDTQQFTWDLSHAGKGVVTVNAPRSKVVCGFVDARSFLLGDVRITPGSGEGTGPGTGATRQGWCTLGVTLMEGDSFTGKGRLLIVATGYTENTGMGWKNEQKNTVGRDWGTAPTLVEAVPAKVELPVPPARVEAWALDETGQRGSALKVEEHAGHAVIPLGPPSATLWYEVVVK